MNIQPVTPQSPDIGATIDELQDQVDQYAHYSTQRSAKGGVLSSFNLGLNSIYVYIAIPVVIFILLLVFQPSFIYVETPIGEEGETTQKVSIKKLFMWSLIIGATLDLGLYGFNYKMKKPTEESS